MLKRTITALVIIAAVIPPLLFGGILLDILVALIMVVGGLEMVQLLPSFKQTNKAIYFIFMFLCFGLLFVDFEIAIAASIFASTMILALPVFDAKFSSKDALVFAGIFMFFFGFGKSFVEIYHANPMYIWFIIIATYACDTGAYFTGYFFGKHKLCERVSPKKTIEGSIGGILLSYLCAGLFAYFMISDGSWELLLTTGIFLPIISQIGDLAFSAIKRNYGIKDFSNIFPGHGGFLDRVDSLVYNLVFFYTIMVVIL